MKQLMYLICLTFKNIIQQCSESLKNNSVKTLSLSDHNSHNKVIKSDYFYKMIIAFSNLEN